MADVNKRMRSVQHGYGGLSATMEHRETDAGSHSHDEVSKYEKDKKRITVN